MAFCRWNYCGIALLMIYFQKCKSGFNQLDGELKSE